ncbi:MULTISPECIES: hypothetical protein [Cupriavidus]|uniref:DUF5983 domain-containing protein n=1 Tax=Cupriavidus basilensis TaxID=68895 RepID=A0A643FSC8_9BURK|nr:MULTISPECIES: hypothetical protein [Cupriavidus]NOV23589.1 hypothetical protein [Cupriavidus necator]QOT81663.1 hypothetical protein F7R26_037240 [Cupriavidus basilensis]BDB30126.1 hypothetical protein CTP10_R75430 [Cupriavidus sp. P-10]
MTSLSAELRLGITMKKLPVNDYLTLSAFHLSEETFCCFGQEPVLANNFASYFVEVINVYAPSARHYAIPEDLEKVMQYAMSLGITLLHFDVTADEIEVLPRYEWS